MPYIPLTLGVRGCISIHGSKGSAILDEDATYAAFLIQKWRLPGGGGETPLITFVPHQMPQPIGTETAH